MTNQHVLLPYFLDEPLPQLRDLVEPDWQVLNPTLPAGEKLERIAALYEPLAGKVAEILSAGDRPVTVAGDCVSSIGVTAGIQRAGLDARLIWFDAHGDFNTWETSPSGFLGGMPLAMLVGRGEQTLLESLCVRPIREDHVILSDGRDLDPAEGEALRQSKVLHLTDVAQLLDTSLPDTPLHIHFDVDVIDPAEAPAMSYSAPGGPSAEELTRVFRHLAATGRVRVVSLSSWNPALDPDFQTQRLCMQVLQALIDD
ncbi:MAG: arginase family protein [Anaerolineales bacterium]